MLVGGFCALETEPDEQFPVFMLIKCKEASSWQLLARKQSICRTIPFQTSIQVVVVVFKIVNEISYMQRDT